ncbi:MAG: peptide chain release factor H [Chitinophagaceae bacterium]|nr:peptide chain release factor H [Chitinophagaceae bacterium]
MEKIMVQISAGQGPAECCLVVSKVLALLQEDIISKGFGSEMIDCVHGVERGTFRSVILMVRGPGCSAITAQWRGCIQWIAQSPYRPSHKRKNWFVNISTADAQVQSDWSEKDIRFETCRSSGPGGQNVNKVETAVRGTHIPSGIQVLAMDSRSQLQNKKHCIERLQAKVLLAWSGKEQEQQQRLWQEHAKVQRGNAVKVYRQQL